MKNRNLKKKTGLLLIRGICGLFIISGIAGFISVCKGDSISVPKSARDYTYRDVNTEEGAQGALYSLGIVCIGGFGLLLAGKEK